MRPRPVIVVVLVALAMAVMACSESRRPRRAEAMPGDAGSLDSGRVDRDAGRSDAGPRDAGPRDAATRDAATRDGAVRVDAAMCDVARCPAASPERLPSGGSFSAGYIQERCCGREDDGPMEGKCGVTVPQAYGDEDGVRCETIVEGELDETCLDTIIGGQLIQGCRRSDGRCGHLNAGWGCHLVYRHYWDDLLDDATTTLPNPFNCTGAGQPCTRTTQCCFHPNYGAQCVPDDWDAGVLEGICDDQEDPFLRETPFPRF